MKSIKAGVMGVFRVNAESKLINSISSISSYLEQCQFKSLLGLSGGQETLAAKEE